MAKNIFETLMGAIVLLVAVVFILIAYEGGNVEVTDGYILTAKFDRIDGLSVGSDVRVSGLTVGSVVAQSIDPKTYLAMVKVTVKHEVQLPKDSTAEIISSGLLGGKYLALVPGGSEIMFKDGDEVQFTQSSVSIESLIGKFMFGGTSGEKDEKDEDEDIF